MFKGLFILIRFILIAAVILSLFSAIGIAQLSQPPNIIIIGWDGTQRDHLKEMIQRNELPNLMALVREGTLVDIDVINGATDTKAGWAQILTGYFCEKTGVYNNRNYQPIPAGYTLFERVEQYFGTDTIETRAVIGKGGNVGADSSKKIPFKRWQQRMGKQKQIDQKQFGKGGIKKQDIITENGKRFVITPAEPFFNAKKSTDLFINRLKTNEAVGTQAIKSLDECKDQHFLFFIHFAEPDPSGHRYSENSLQYTDAIKSDDLWTGKIIDRIKELGIYERTMIYITSDHGFDEGLQSHRYAPYVFLATNDRLINRNGTREDIAPTVLKRMGLDLSTIEPKLDGIPLDEPAPERKAAEEKPR